jgi:hypothetical protein
MPQSPRSDAADQGWRAADRRRWPSIRSAARRMSWMLFTAAALSGTGTVRGACNYAPADCAVYAASVDMQFSDGASATGSMTFTLVRNGAGPWTGAVTTRFPGCPSYNSSSGAGNWSIFTVAENVFNLGIGGSDRNGVMFHFVTATSFAGAGTYGLHASTPASSYLQDPCGYTPSRTLIGGQIVITKTCSFPSIISQPRSVAISVGETATLEVGATGTGLAYQWYEGPRYDRTKPIPGATSASLEVSSSGGDELLGRGLRRLRRKRRERCRQGHQEVVDCARRLVLIRRGCMELRHRDRYGHECVSSRRGCIPAGDAHARRLG